MIDRDHGYISFICDGDRCFECFETDERDWDKALAAFKAEWPKWHMTKEGDEWHHYCQDCWQDG